MKDELRQAGNELISVPLVCYFIFAAMLRLFANFFYFSFTLAAFSFFTSCHRKKEKPLPKFVNETELLQDAISSIIKDELTEYTENKYLTIDSDTIVSAEWIKNFYTEHKFLPVWTTKGKLTGDADSLLSFIRDAGRYGLIPEDYHLENIAQRQSSAYDSTKKKFNVTKLAETDLLFTDAFFTLCVHLRKGRINPDSLTTEWKGAQMDTNAVALLNHTLVAHTIRETLESLEPAIASYSQLKKSLSEFRERFENNPWDSLPVHDTVTFKEKLRWRLLQSDDYDSTLTKNDSVKLARAVQSFQRKHGLNADGKSGVNTLRMLGESAGDHIHHLEMNLERWRWEKPVHEDRYVWINIPSFTFTFIDSDSVALKSRIICGAPDKQSPELNSTINYYIIYPYWNVPFSIATKEFLPILKRDTGYLSRHNMEVLDNRNHLVDPKKINWKKLNDKYFPYKIRQRDGDENTLGVMKFIFSNKFGVYLHDTNARNLFGKEVRALSHGCFRLEKAKAFAEYLVKDDTLSFTVDSLHYYLEQKVQRRVPLTPHLPIHIRYFTCEADSNGVIFYDDVYKRDEKMIRELYK